LIAIAARASASVCSGEAEASAIAHVTKPISNPACLRTTPASASDASGPRDSTTVKPRRQIGNQEQPAEFRVRGSSGGRDRGALFRSGEDRVEDDGITGARDAYGLNSQAVIDFFGYFRSIRFGRQVAVF
jgi:hypothetical protein